MPAKRDLNRGENDAEPRLRLRRTETHLKDFNDYLRHVAKKNDEVRLEAESILRQFKSLAGKLKKKADGTAGVPGDGKSAT